MLIWFYKLPLWLVIFGTIFVIVFSSVLKSFFYQFASKRIIYNIVSFVGLIASFVLIVHATLISRSSNIYETQLMPFQSLILAKTQPEMYRTMLMNVVLFVPIGIAMSFINSKFVTCKTHFIIVLFISMVLSSLIELFQFLYNIGLCQTDDTICNVLGALLGSLTFPLSQYFSKTIIKNKNI